MLLGHHFFFLSCCLAFLPFILSHQLAFFFICVVKFWNSSIPYFYKSKVLSRSSCTKMFLNNFYLMVCSRRITSNTPALVFNLTKENTNWNSILLWFSLRQEILYWWMERLKKDSVSWICSSHYKSGIFRQSYLEKLTIGDKYINKRIRLSIHQTKHVWKIKC